MMRSPVNFSAKFSLVKVLALVSQTAVKQRLFRWHGNVPIYAPGPIITLDKETIHCLTEYSWPGNVRELENVIERAVTLSQGGVVTIEDLPERIRQQQSHDTPPLSPDELAEIFSGLPNLDEIERRYILHVLDATGNNRKRTAEILGINRKTLYRMAARFRIESF